MDSVVNESVVTEKISAKKHDLPMGFGREGHRSGHLLPGREVESWETDLDMEYRGGGRGSVAKSLEVCIAMYLRVEALENALIDDGR